MSENIEVVAAFTGLGKFKPTAFKYGQKLYRVHSINLFHSVKVGANRQFVFNVSDGANNWVLMFDTQTLRWTLNDQYSYS